MLSIYILLEVLVCSIAVYFYESCSIMASPEYFRALFVLYEAVLDNK